jgi:hypothetical protein
MGATAAIGAGLSVVSGLGNASAAKKSADAQKKAIANQNKVDQLNSQLQLLQIKQQRELSRLQDATVTAAETQAFQARLGQLNLQETSNQIALAEAANSTRTQEQLAVAKQQGAETSSLSDAVGQRQQINVALASAIGASADEQKQVIDNLRNMPERDRARAIASIMDVVATGGGENAALAMLTELTGDGGMANVARAEEAGNQKVALANASANATSAQVEANRQATNAGAGLEATDATYAARTAALDAQASKEVADQSFASERLSTTGAYNASQLARGVEASARELSLDASEETTSTGAAIANSTAAAQAGAVRSPGFFDYMAIGANAYTTYTGLKAKSNIMGA